MREVAGNQVPFLPSYECEGGDGDGFSTSFTSRDILREEGWKKDPLLPSCECDCGNRNEFCSGFVGLVPSFPLVSLTWS